MIVNVAMKGKALFAAELDAEAIAGIDHIVLGLAKANGHDPHDGALSVLYLAGVWRRVGAGYS